MRFSSTYLMLVTAAILCIACCPEEEPPISTEDPEVEVPSEPDPEPDPIPDGDYSGWETASVAVANMGIGWNLGNTLDTHNATGERGDDWLYWETYWGQYQTTPELMRMMKEAGFGAIRVPVTWGIHMDADNNVFDSWMNRVHEIVDYVLDAGMYCIVNVHHDTGAGDGVWLYAGMDAYEQVRDKYTSLWTQIAEEFKDYDHRLLFESYNEMLDTRKSWCFASFNGGYDADFAVDAYEAINTYAQTFVDAVRATGGNNTARNLIVNTYAASCGSGNWNIHIKDPLKEMKLPKDILDDHLIFEVHSYPQVDNLPSMKAEVNDMFSALQTHLVSKGAPVIIGEWATSTETPFTENVQEFLDYFVTKSMEYDMGTFYWMSISDGVARSIPCFSHPEYARAILKAYHGDSYEPILPTIDDFDCSYYVTYSKLWGELYLCDHSISLDEYTGIYLLLDSVPAVGELAIKIYGEDDKVQYEHFADNELVVHFNPNVVGDISTCITLQHMKDRTYTVGVLSSALVRKDGTYVPTTPSVFWGCDMKLTAVPR